MNTLYYLITTVFDLYIMVVLLRFWLQLARADFYNPFSQFVVKVTNPVIMPLRRVIPGFGGLDIASLLLAFIVIVLKLTILQALAGQLNSEIIISFMLFGLLGLIKQCGMLIFWVLILRAILSWVSQGRSPVEYVLAQLSEPLMAPIRKVIPPIGGLDLSILILLLAMNLINQLMLDWVGQAWVLL